MPKKVRMWYYNPSKPPKPKIDEFAKQGIKKKCDRFIDSVLKPRFVSNEQTTSDELFVIGIYSKWWRNYIYFHAKYQDDRSEAIEPTFDLKLVRMEYLEENKYDLAYFRHTGKWWVIFHEIPLEECFEAIEDMPHFHPI